MAIRQAVYAGQFYPAAPEQLRAAIRQSFQAAGRVARPVQHDHDGADTADYTFTQPIMTLMPHAGYVYSGPVAAAVLSEIELCKRLFVLCPSHTGEGNPLGVWSEGAWVTPLGAVPIDAELAAELLAQGGGFTADARPHMREHSIEVVLPFLQLARSNLSIVPIVVRRRQQLSDAAHAVAAVMRKHADSEGKIGLIISSDMNHYADEQETKRRDNLAIQAILRIDPQALIEVVSSQSISMCGVLPAVIGLLVCLELGARQAALMAYDTSGSAFGDSSRVVGYAGIRIW